MGDDWFVALRGEFVKPYFKEVRAFYHDDGNVDTDGLVVRS